MLAVDQKTSAPDADPAPGKLSKDSLEAEVIGLFVQLSRIAGIPRSYAEIYALLFISGKPLAMDEVIERLGISKGSASQGLNFLRKAGAIKMVYILHDRRVHYEAVAELRHLVVGFLRDQIVPQLESSRQRLDYIGDLVRKLPAQERARLNGRVTMLQSWAKRSRKFVPLIVKLLEH